MRLFTIFFKRRTTKKQMLDFAIKYSTAHAETTSITCAEHHSQITKRLLEIFPNAISVDPAFIGESKQVICIQTFDTDTALFYEVGSIIYVKDYNDWVTCVNGTWHTLNRIPQKHFLEKSILYGCNILNMTEKCFIIK